MLYSLMTTVKMHGLRNKQTLYKNVKPEKQKCLVIILVHNLHRPKMTQSMN